MSIPIDSTDRQIIRELQANGRRSNVEIARALGLSEATVRKRIDRLLDEGVIRITAILDPTHLGWPVHVLIALRVEPGHLDTVGQQVAAFPMVHSVTLATGDYDLFVRACFPSTEGLLHFLTVDLAGIPGITRTTTHHLLRVIKDMADWRLPELTSPCILLADDDPDFVEATRLVLEAQGYTVQAVASGDETLAAMRTCRPNLVILDVMMRGVLDGLYTAETIASDPTLRTVPIIMISSIADSKYAEVFPTDRHIPVAEFLCKPIAPAQLLAAVRAALR